jgi:hypothetical protein
MACKSHQVVLSFFSDITLGRSRRDKWATDKTHKRHWTNNFFKWWELNMTKRQ